MAASRIPLNRFERLLFGIALAVGIAVVLVRVAAMILLPYLHHSH